MARDYATRGKPASRKHARGTKSGGGVPGWAALLAGLALGLAVAAWVYIRTPTPSRPADAGSVPAAADPALEIPSPGEPRFTFYKLLPSEEVVIPDAPEEKLEGSSAKDGATYLIQVASFRERAEADRQKARLALLGIESKVETVTVNNRDTYYRVRIGPERDRAEIERLMAQLSENGIEALLVRLR